MSSLESIEEESQVQFHEDVDHDFIPIAYNPKAQKSKEKYLW